MTASTTAISTVGCASRPGCTVTRRTCRASCQVVLGWCVHALPARHADVDPAHRLVASVPVPLPAPGSAWAAVAASPAGGDRGLSGERLPGREPAWGSRRGGSRSAASSPSCNWPAPWWRGRRDAVEGALRDAHRRRAGTGAGVHAGGRRGAGPRAPCTPRGRERPRPRLGLRLRPGDVARRRLPAGAQAHRPVGELLPPGDAGRDRPTPCCTRSPTPSSASATSTTPSGGRRRGRLDAPPSAATMSATLRPVGSVLVSAGSAGRGSASAATCGAARAVRAATARSAGGGTPTSG